MTRCVSGGSLAGSAPLAIGLSSTKPTTRQQEEKVRMAGLAVSRGKMGLSYLLLDLRTRKKGLEARPPGRPPPEARPAPAPGSEDSTRGFKRVTPTGVAEDRRCFLE